MHACSLLKGRTNKRQGGGVSSFLPDDFLAVGTLLLGDTERVMGGTRKQKNNALLHTVDLWKLLELVSKGLPASPQSSRSPLLYAFLLCCSVS